jgi:hypothetical protein
MQARAGTAFENGEYIDMAREQRTRAAVAACALARRVI